MSAIESEVREICREVGDDPTRLVGICREVQRRYRCVSPDAQRWIADEVGVSRLDVRAVVAFYAFLTEAPLGQVVIRLSSDIPDQIKGSARIAEALERELGIGFGETTPDGRFTLEWTPCIGMCDQAPSALVNDIPMTYLNTDTVVTGIRKLKEHMDPQKLVRRVGDGNNASDLIGVAVDNNIRKRGEVLLADYAPGVGLANALKISPAEVIRSIKTSRLRGRGGAGFPAGMKWEFTRAAPGAQKYIICNADEGEPGTFKDRVLLTERAHLLFEGMTIAGYAIGASKGILYLRGEYTYLLRSLEHVLERRREQGLLGDRVLGRDDFAFDIRIQMGAGAYICGEESALINSCEGKPGEPRNRPPYPAQRGYRDCPTSVNNVETLCCVPRILERGASWFNSMGSVGSSGTKLISVSGDCTRPGIYEIPFGMPLSTFFKLCGAQDPQAALVGGPSGRIVGPDEFDRAICFDHLATGGALIVFNHERDLLEVVRTYIEFFVEESCGYCTPCRVGNQLLLERVGRIADGQGDVSDLEYLRSLSRSVKMSSRCGLGQTSPNPILSTLDNFPQIYESRLQQREDRHQPSFDIHAHLSDAVALTGRQSVHFDTPEGVS